MNKIQFKPLLLIIFFIFIFFFFLHPLEGDGDFFHHLNTGTYVLRHLALPKVDEYTFTARGIPWVGYGWGTGVVFYIIYSSLGALGINIFIALLAVITFALLYLLLRTYKIPEKVCLLVLALGATPISIRWPNRPELITYPAVLSILLVDRFTNKYPKIMMLYPLIILVWANMYGSSVIFGLGLLILIGIKNLKQKVKLNKLLYTSLLLSFPISLLNGYGLRSILYVLYIPQISQIQTEWGGIIKNLRGPIDYELIFQYMLLLYLLFLAFYIFTAILAIKKIKRFPFQALLSLAIFLPFVAFRQITLGVILTLPFIALSINEAAGRKRQILISALLIISIVSIFISAQTDKRGIGQDSGQFPNKLASFFNKHNLSGRVFNNQQIGAFLTYHLYPKILVYSDTRDDLFINTSVLPDLENTFLLNRSVLPLLIKYRADFVVGDASDGTSYAQLLNNPEWPLIYLDGRFMVFARKQIVIQKKIVTLNFIDPYSSDFAKKGQEKSAEKEFKQIIASGSDSLQNKLRLSQLLIANDKPRDAIKILSAIPMDNYPDNLIVKGLKDYLLAGAYLLNFDCSRSKQYLDLAKNDISGKLIFNPQQKLPIDLTQINNGYSNVCPDNGLQYAK